MEIGCYSSAVVGSALPQKLAALKTIGFDFLELALSESDIQSLDDQSMTAISDTRQAARFPIHSLSLGAFSGFAHACKEAETRSAKLKTISTAIELAGRCGASVILCASWEPEGGPAVFDRYVTELPPLADLAASRGVRLAIEHIGSSRFVNSPTGVAKIARAVNHPAVGVYFDIGNSMHAGEDPVCAISRLGDLIFQVHLKGYGDRPLALMPLDAVLSELKANGFDGRAATEVIQSDAVDNNYLAEALATLRAHGY